MEGNEVWDGEELISEKLLQQNHAKDVRRAAERLLDPAVPMPLITKTVHNPTFRQSAYGGQ